MIDATIIIAFLALTLFVGLKHGQQIKSIKEFALGSRNFSTGVLVATLVATWMSGSGFFIDLTMTYSDGLIFMIPNYGMVVAFILTAYVFIPRMQQLLGKLSVAEVLGELYGEKIRFVTAVAGSIGSMGIIAVQFKVFGTVLSHYLNFSSVYGVIGASIIVTFYSAFGGIRSVTFTDMLQAFTFSVSIPIVGIAIWHSIYQSDISILPTLHDPKFDFWEVFRYDNPDIFSMVALFFYFAMPAMTPVIFQRISMGKDVAQSKKAFLITAAIILVTLLSSQWIPFLVYTINPDLNIDGLLPFIIDNYATTGIRGLLIVGIIALAMSTADSHINSASVLFSYDVCQSLGVAKRRELIISKFVSLVLGVICIYLALSGDNLLKIVLSANSFYLPIVSAPLLLTILGLRTTRLSIAMGMVGGGLTVIGWKYILLIEANPITIGMLVNAALVLTTHYLFRQSGGWIDTRAPEVREEKDNKDDEESADSKQVNRGSKIKKFFAIHFPTNDFAYVGLGMYYIIYTISTMYNTQSCVLNSNCGWVLYMYQMMLVLSMVIMTYPIWPVTIDQDIKRSFVHILWPISIVVMLVLFNSFFVIISDFSPLQFAVFTANLLITANLLGWRLSPLVIIVGCFASIWFYFQTSLDLLTSTEVGSPSFIIIYILALIGASIVIFLKPKQEDYDEKSAKVSVLETENTMLGHESSKKDNTINALYQKVTHFSEKIDDQAREIERLGETSERILNNLNHELRLPVGNVMNFSEMLHEGLGKYTDVQLKELSEEVFKNSTRLSSMILNMLDLATLNVKRIELRTKTINFGDLVEQRVKRCRSIYLQGKPIDFNLSIEPELLIAIDPNYMRQVVDNLIINAINFSEDGVIDVRVKREGNKILLQIQDEGKGIPPEEIYDIFTPFKMGSNSFSKAEGRGVGLALCKSAVEAHGGTIIAKSLPKGALFFVLLPL